MQDLADEAGLSRVTLYRRGATRDNVLQALRAELRRSATRSGRRSSRTARAGAAGARAACAVRERGGHARAVRRAHRRGVGRDDHDGDERRLTREEFVAPFRRLLLDGAADGSLRSLPDPDEVATILYNQVSWTYRHLRRATGWDAERAAAGVITLALDGLAAW